MAIIRPKDNRQSDLIASTQTLTGSWADLGGVIDTRDVEKIALWQEITANDSVNIRFRMVCLKTETATDVFNPQIETVGTSVVSAEDEYYEFNVDANKLSVSQHDVLDMIDYVKFQVQCGTVGSTAGTIDTAQISVAIKE